MGNIEKKEPFETTSHQIPSTVCISSDTAVIMIQQQKAQQDRLAAGPDQVDDIGIEADCRHRHDDERT